MNHYQTLGVASNAAFSEIKAAFKKRVKTVHPDLNPEKDGTEFIRLKEAYDILSDSASRSLYDLYLSGVPVQSELESSTEEHRYRANYRWRKAQEYRARMEAQVVYKQKFYRFLRYVAMIYLLIALLLSYDYYQSSWVYHLFPEEVVTIRRNAVIFFDGGNSVEVSKEFLNEYRSSTDKEVQIYFSALLDIPIWIKMTNSEQKFLVKGTIYVFRNAFSFLLFIFSIVVVGNKSYTDFRLTCGIVATMVVFWILLIVGPYL